MSRIRRKTAYLAVWLFSILMLSSIMKPTAAAAAEQPVLTNNLSSGLRKTSSLTVLADGYMRVVYDGQTDSKNPKIYVEYYDKSFTFKSRKTLSMELPYWGGFYAGSNAYYLVEGQPNTEEKDDLEVIRVIKYDTKWNRLGAAGITGNPKIFGGEVGYPFHYGCVEFYERGSFLYFVTGHRGYVDERYGQGHQGFLMVRVDTGSMTGKIVKSNLGHSFAQYITAANDSYYVLQLSEGGRATTLTWYDAAALDTEEADGSYNWNSKNTETSLDVLPYGGTRTSAWSIATYSSVDGVAASASHILGVGTSIDQTKYDSVTSDTPHNIYLTVTPLSNFTEEATQVKWLTGYTGGGKSFVGLKITKVNDNRFMISWEETETETKTASDENDALSSGTLHYLFVDGAGNKLTKEYTERMTISECQPVVSGSQVIYYASDNTTLNFYSINADTGKASKTTYRSAGKNASWKLKNGVLTISGTGAMEMSIDEDAGDRSVLSSTSGWSSYSNYETAWPNAVRTAAKKVVVEEGITSIPERAFASLPQLTEVVIPSTVKSIGKEAFAECGKLKKITLPKSVKTIGEDILWTGYTWVFGSGHVYSGEIHTSYNSAAHKYAKKYSIPYVIDLGLSGAKISGLEKSYTLSGSKVTPKITVSIGSKKLSSSDYKIKYKDNTKAGKATVEVTGRNSYGGTISATFKITTSKTEKEPAPKISGVSPSAAKPLSSVDSTVLKQKNDNDLKGSSFCLLQAKGSAKSNTSIKISWSKVDSATGYVVYGSPCGKGKTYKKLKTVKGTSFTQKKLKKGTYYKYMVVAVKGSKAIAVSKTLHIVTKGGKNGNDKAVTLNTAGVRLKVGKSKTLKAATTPESRKLSVKKHRAVSFESSNPSIATVSSKGKIKAKKKGTCYVYAYAQNGVYKKVKVTVS